MNSNAIGLHVKYYDYLGIDRFGTIVAVEPTNMYGSDIFYVYIEDENMDYNIHEDIINGTRIKYAELRLSIEVYIDNERRKL